MKEVKKQRCKITVKHSGLNLTYMFVNLKDIYLVKDFHFAQTCVT